MNVVGDARSVSSDVDPDYCSTRDDIFFQENLKALIKSCDPSDRENLNLMIVNAVQSHDIDFYFGLIDMEYQLQVLNDKGQTALHLAFYNYFEDLLEYAIQDDYTCQDVHVNYSDCNGLTHLHIACHFWSDESDNLAEKYLESGEDVNARFEFDPEGLRSGFTPLHMCVCDEQVRHDCLKQLLKYGANVMARDKMGRTPLHLLCSVYGLLDDSKKLEGMALLLKNGCEVDAKDDEGNTPLHSVFLIGCRTKFPYEFFPEAMYAKYELLRDHQADVTAINNTGNTVLHCVIMNLKHHRDLLNSDDSLHVKIIHEIFSSREGIDVNIKNNAGETFLQIAVSMLSVDIVADLINRNADVSDVTLSRDGRHCFYNDPIFLPDLETVNNAITVVSLLLGEGFEFTDDDKLALIQFLLQDNRNNTWMNVLQQKKIEAYLDNLLNFGSVLKVQRIYRPMALTLLAQNEVHLKNKMYKYAKKWLRCKLKAGIYYDDTLFNFLNISNVRFGITNAAYFGARPELLKEIEKEYVTMKTTYLNDDTTMLSVLKQHPNDIYQRIKDVDLKKLTNKFTVYKSIAEGHFTKSLVRNLIEKLVDNYYLKRLLFPALPDICCRKIFFYLDNEDILNVLSAVTCDNQ